MHYYNVVKLHEKPQLFFFTGIWNFQLIMCNTHHRKQGWCSFEVFFLFVSPTFLLLVSGGVAGLGPLTGSVSGQFPHSSFLPTPVYTLYVCGNLQPSLNLHPVVCSLSEERLTCSPACALWLLHLVTFGLLPAAHRPRLWLHCSTTQARLTQFIKLISANLLYLCKLPFSSLAELLCVTLLCCRTFLSPAY